MGINIEFAAIVLVVACVAVCALVLLALERRYAARLAAANLRERSLASRLESERVARVEAQAIATEVMAERNLLRAEVLTRLDVEQGDLPVTLASLAERTATLVLSKLPMTATERERYAACAALGGLMSAHSYLALAVTAMAAKADLEGPIYTMMHDDGADDDDDDDDDKHDSDPSLQ